MIWENTLSGMVDSTASRFDESTQYKKSDYVWYAATGVKPKLYKAKADMEAGAWNASKWEEQPITITKEFVRKDMVRPLHKNIHEDFEDNKFGYRRYEPWFEIRPASDSTATYQKGDVVYAEDTWSDDWVTFLCNPSEPDETMTFDEVRNLGILTLEWDWDNNRPTEAEGFTPVEGGLYTCRDNNWNLDFYKYSGGTYTKMEPVEKTIDAVKAAGFNVGDWFVAYDGGIAKIFKFLTDNPNYEFVNADLFDVSVCQDEVARKLEDIAPSEYYYGMPFYKDYKLYALLATTPVYEEVAVEGTVDHDEFNIEHFGDVYAVKLDSIDDIRDLFNDGCYKATQALIYNIFDGRFDLPVVGVKTTFGRTTINIVGSPIVDSGAYYDTDPGMIVNLRNDESPYEVKWDFKYSTYQITINGFSKNPEGGDIPTVGNVDEFEITNCYKFTINDNTENPFDPDASIRSCFGYMSNNMSFDECYVNIICWHKKGIFMPGYHFNKCDVNFCNYEDEYVLDFGYRHMGITYPFVVTNSRISFSGNEKIEFEHFTFAGRDTVFLINAPHIVFDDAIAVNETTNCMLQINCEELTLPQYGTRGMFRVNGPMIGNRIRLITNWNDTLKEKHLWYANDTLYYGDELQGAFDNIFHFVDSGAQGILTECPMDVDESHLLIHAKNLMYIYKNPKDLLVWHDFPTA